MANRADYIHNMAERIRKQRNNGSTYQPYQIQTSYGSRTVGEKEYNQKVAQRRKEQEEQKKQQREDDMAARGITSPQMKRIYNANEDAKEYAAALNRASLNKNLQNMKPKVGENAWQISPASIKLQKGLSQNVVDELGKKIENEQNIISNQGRDANSPEVKNAQKTLKDLQGRMADAQKWQRSLPKTGELAPMGKFEATAAGVVGPAYSPEEEAYIRKIQQRLENGQKKKQPIGYAYTPEENYRRHMQNTPDGSDQAEYMRWLKEGEKIGLYDRQTMNAMIANMGDLTPAEQYQQLSASEKSGWLREGTGAMRMKSLEEARKYNDEHGAGQDKELLQQQLEYWQTLADDAQKRFDLLHGNIGIEFAPEGQEPYTVRSRMNPYYRDPQYKEQIDEKFFDAIAGTGAYQKTKEEFLNDPEMGQDGFDYLMEVAWDDYEKGNYDQLYYDLTGENDYADTQSQLNHYNDQIKDIQNQLTSIEKYEGYMQQYQDVVRDSYVQENDRGYDSLVDYGTKEMPYERPRYRDPNTSDIHRIYSFINEGNEFYAYYKDTPEDQRQITRAYGNTAFMLPDEIEVFNGFYNAGQYDKAMAFYQGLRSSLHQRASYYEEIDNREEARKYPIMSSFASLEAELASGFTAPFQAIAGAAGSQEVRDPDSPVYAGSRFSTQTQEEIADMIGGEGGKVYLAGMNALRNMMNAAAISTLGITGPWAGAAGLAMFATQIYQDSTYKYLKEYNDYDKAVSYALLDAALETMEEKLPYDVMLSGGSNIFLNWLASSLSEGLEELTGATLGEEIKAQLTNSGRREWEIRRDKIYNEGGYTDEAGNWITIDTKDSRKALAEAQTQALREYGQQIISNTLSGMAGGGIGGIYGGINNYVQNTRIGRTINNQANNVDNTSGGTQLINVARGMFNESQSRQLAEQLYKKTQENKKVSNYEIGKLARSIVLETSQEGGKITRETVERLIQQQMRNGGANEDTIKEAAPIIASAVIDGNKLSKGEFNVLAGSKQAIDTYKTFMSSEGALTAAATAVSNPDVQKMQSIRETVGKLMEGGKGKAVAASVTADIVKAAEKTRIANQDDLDHVTKGVQTGSGMDAILNDEIVQVIGRNKDGYEIQHEDGTTETVSEDSILAVDKKLGVLMEYGMQNSGLLGDMGFAEIVKGIAQNGKAGDGQYLAEAMKIYLAARTLGAQPVSILNKETADAIWKAAEEDNAQANKDRMADRQEKAIPGKGTSEFNGAQYGTKEWNQKLNEAGLTKQQKNQAGAVAEYAKRLGFHVTFVNNPDMEAEYGWEDRATGRIYINLAGKHADYTIGGKKYSGDSHNLLVTASHEFTHWLEQNSPQEYAELRQFVFNKLRRAGQDIESLVMHKMDLYRSMAEATKAADTEAQVQELDLEGAMAEIVANACDQVLGSEKVAAEIEKESPNLYEKVKQFVTNLVARIREAAAGMDSSMSRESRIMTTWADELQDHWLRTLKEAQGREQGQAEAQEGVQHSRREEDFSYENLTKKGNVNIAKMEEISDSDFQTEESKSSNEFARDIINEIKARNNGSVEVVNNDTKDAIIIAKDGIKHSRGRELTKGYVQVARQIDNILKNSIAVNELEGRPNVSNYSTIYIGIAETDDDYVAVRTIVNNKNHRTESVDVLYAISKNEIKKGGSAIKAPGPLAQIARGSGSPSLISVTDMLDIVKRADNAATVLSKDVADKLGITRKNIKGLSESLKYSIRELSNQDQEYADAVDRGDMQAATDMLMDKLQQTENIIPFNAPNWYAGEHADVAQLIKNGTPEAIAKAAASMASYVPDNAALVPMPNHHGEVNANTDTMILANALSELTGRPVIAALAGADRESRYDSKVAGGRGIQANEMGFRQVAEIPEGMIPIFIDNVVGSGETAKAARDALGGGITLAYAKSVRSKGIQGLKRATVTYDKNGNLIPLSERFNPNVRDIRYSIREMNDEYMRAVNAGDMEAAQKLVDQAAKEAGYIKAGYHGTLSGGFTIFDKAKAGIGGNSGAGFYFTSNKSDSEANYHNVEGADNWFKASDLAEKLMEMLSESDEDEIEYEGYKVTTDMDYNEVTELAKQILTKNPQIYSVYLNPGKAYIRDYKNSTNLLEDAMNEFDESLIDRDDYDDEDEYYEAVSDARYEEMYQALSDAVYNGIADVESHYEFYTNVDYEGIIGKLWEKALDWEALTWDDLAKVLAEEYIEIGTPEMTNSTDGSHEIARAIVEAFGFDSIEDREVSTKFNQLKNMGKAGETTHYIMFRPEQIKLADAVTRDNDGNAIPLDQRFRADHPDIRWSFRDEGDMEINRWMQGLTPSSLKTEQERVMLRQWQEAKGGLDVAWHALSEHQAKLRKLEAMQNPSAFDRNEIIKEKNRIQNWRAKVDDYEKQMVKATREKGFAHLMYSQSKLMDDLASGRSVEQVKETVEAIKKEIARVDAEMAAREQKIKELADSAAVKQIESLMSGVQLDRMAKWLRTTYNSNFNKQQLMANLSEIRLKMASGEDVTSDAEELAWKLLYGIQAESDSVLAAMRGITLRLGPAQIREIYGSDMSLKEIRSRLAGTGIKVEKAKKSGLDADWQQLVKMVPELDTEENKNELNQVSAILNLVEKRKEEQQNYGVNQYGGNIADVTNDVLAAAAAVNLDAPKDPAAMAILKRMNTLINEMAGGMKKGAEELAEAREKLAELAEKGKLASDLSDWVKKDIQDAIAYNNALAQQSEAATWKNERHKLINQLNDEHTKAMLKQQEEFREKLENDKTARGKMNENMALRRRINTNVNRLRKLLIHESTKDNVPEHMKGIVREMLTRIVDNDLTGRKITGIAREDLIEISRVLTAFEKQDGKYNPDDLKTMDEAVQDVLYNALEDLKSGIEYYNGQTKGKKLLENLESFNGALTEISNAVSAITGIVNAERSIVLGNRRTSVENQAYKVQEYAGDRRKQELTGKVGMTLNEIHKFVISGNLTPEYFFRMLKNAGLDELWEEYHREENKNGLELAKAKERLDQIAKKYGFAAWDMEKRQEVNLQSGKVNMTLGQIMSLYATWKREHTLGPAMSQHLTHGGFYVEEVDPRKGIIGSQVTDLKAHRVKDEDMEQVGKLLTKEQIDFVNEIVSYMSNEMSELGNDASMKAYGIKLYKESYYFPFKMWDGVKAKASNDSGSAARVDQVFRPSFSKTRLHGANNAVILGDFMQTATDHIVGMINYATMGLANENMQKVLNAQVAEGDRLDTMTKRNIRTVLQEAYGKEAMQYLAKLQEQLNGGAVRMDRTLYDKALTLFRKNAVAGSMSVTLQQPLSYIRAAMLINPKYLAQAISPTYWKDSYAEMMAHSGVANIKKMGRFDMGFGASAREYITPDGMETKARKVWNEITDKATILPELADRMTWTRMWSAVKLEQHELHPKMDMNSEEFLDMVATRFNELMRRTQVYDSVLTKSQNMRSQNPFMKSITSFMAEPTLSLNVLMDAARNVKEKGGKAMLAKAVTTFLLSAVAQAAVKAVMSSGRSPDDKKTWAENFWYRFWQNAINETDPLNLVPGYNDLVTVLKSGKLEDDALGAIGKIFSAGEKLMNITGNPADYRSWEDSAGQLVQLFTKLPAKNIMRDLRASYNWFISKTYADRDTSGAVLRQQTMASFMTADNLIGAINAKLGEAGYKTSNEAYYNRLYGAMQSGNKQTAEDIKEYLQLIKNQDEKKQATGLRAAAKKDESLTTAQQDEWMLKNDLLDSTATLTTQYKEGKITADEYKKLAKAAEPELTDNDVWWKIDRIDYQKEKGGDSVSGYYYRLTDAVNANKVEDIQKAVKDLLAHGITKEKIKSKLSDWKQAYLAADNAGKIKIRDALQKAYKAAGYTAKDADKTIESWKKDAEKKK